jgi:hypothetical protein
MHFGRYDSSPQYHQIVMRMGVNKTRRSHPPMSVNLAVSFSLQVCSQPGDAFPYDADIAHKSRVTCAVDNAGSANDQIVHAGPFLVLLKRVFKVMGRPGRMENSSEKVLLRDDGERPVQ